MEQFELFESDRIETAKIVFKDPPPVRIAPIDEDINTLELEEPERWDGLS